MKERVSIVKLPGDGLPEIRAALRRALDLTDRPLEGICPGATVVIKPNITAENLSWRQGVVTNPDLVRAIVELVSERKPGRILIAEAIAVGLNVKNAYAYLGYHRIAAETGAELVDLYDEEFVTVPVPGSEPHRSLEVSKVVLDADFLINVPVLKTHVAAGISVGMKNLMGTISVEQKKRFHFFGVADSVVDLNTVVRPQLTVADGIAAGEGDGPMANEPVGFLTLLAGTDARAVDTVCARVMGFETREIPILGRAEERLGVLAPADILVAGEGLASATRAFKRAADRVNPTEGIVCAEGEACGACTGVLELALARARQMGILEKLRPLRILCGAGAGSQGGGQNTLVVGKCLSELKDSAHYVPGCPPQVFLVADELREMAGVDRIFGSKDGYVF